jgi:hypothetical protein
MEKSVELEASFEVDIFVFAGFGMRPCPLKQTMKTKQNE